MTRKRALTNRAGLKIGTPIVLLIVAISLFSFLFFASYSYPAHGSGDVKIIYPFYVQLYAGAPSNTSSRGSARIEAVFQNEGVSTALTSISISGTGVNTSISVFQCDSSTHCNPYEDVMFSVNDKLVSYNTTGSAFYLSVGLLKGSYYNCYFAYTNGENFTVTRILAN